MNIFERIQKAWHRKEQLKATPSHHVSGRRRGKKHTKSLTKTLGNAQKYINKPETQKKLGNLAQMGTHVDEHAKRISKLLWGD